MKNLLGNINQKLKEKLFNFLNKNFFKLLNKKIKFFFFPIENYFYNS